LQDRILALIQGCKTCSAKNTKTIEQACDGLCEKCSIAVIAYNRYFRANIPCEYWDLSMKDFSGPETLKKVYNDITADLFKVYRDGNCILLAGNNGLGKSTVVCNILKKACQKNYYVLYSTLSDIISALIDAPGLQSFVARKELMQVDFLVVDEFDSKYVSEGAADLFGRTIEHIFRTRLQNKLPTLFCSNSPNPIEMFNGSIKKSIQSLMYKTKLIPITGPDFRKQVVS
jgi:DNA replication protein DnaC